jgi:hypothetical protein
MHLLGRAHHRADGGGFGLGLAAALAQVAGTRGFLVGAAFDRRRPSREPRWWPLSRASACALATAWAASVSAALAAGRAFLGRGIGFRPDFRFSFRGGTRLFGGALAGFLLLALLALGGQLFFLAADQLGLAAGFLLAAGEFGFVRALRRGRLGHFRRFHTPVSEPSSLLMKVRFVAHFHLDRARLARGVGPA